MYAVFTEVNADESHIEAARVIQEGDVDRAYRGGA